jgi:ribose 5-phosphate isomerase A
MSSALALTRHAATQPDDGAHAAVHAAAHAAAKLVADGAHIGLGSGRAASAFIVALGERVRAGLRVDAVATSSASETLASQSGIPVAALASGIASLDLVVDGADEVAPNLDLVKGWGGALVRERIVTAAARRQVILVDESKLVRLIGQRGRVPVEVIPFARSLVESELRRLHMVPVVRATGGTPFVSENGNIIIDCAFPAPLPGADQAREFERQILAIAGVVDTGLFLGTASEVFVGHADGHVETMRRPG